MTNRLGDKGRLAAILWAGAAAMTTVYVGCVPTGTLANEDAGADGASSGSGGGSGGSSSGGSSSGSSSGGGGSSSGGSSSGGGSGGGSGGSSSSSGGGSSSGGSSSSSGGDGGDGGGLGTCASPASSVPAADVLPYVPVVQKVGSCSPTDISEYLAACAPGGSGCDAWLQQLKTGRAACYSCLLPATPNTGGILTDYLGQRVGVNTPGCLQARYHGNWNQCALALAQVDQCQAAAGCVECSTLLEQDSCFSTTDGNACRTYNQATFGPCEGADGGKAACEGDPAVLEVICGTG